MGPFHFSRSQTIALPRRVYQCPKVLDFKVDVDIVCCVHGFLDRDRKQPASLIVFAAQLSCVSKGSFRRFQMEVDFCDRDQTTPPCKPKVIRVAPFSTEERLYEVRATGVKTKEQEEIITEAGMTAALEAPAPKFSLRGNLGWKKRSTREVECSYQVYYSKGSSKTHFDKSGDRNGVSWNVKEDSNPEAKDHVGIPLNYRFAVLVLRDSHTAPFEAHIHPVFEGVYAYKKDKILHIIDKAVHILFRRNRPLSGKFKSHDAECDPEAEPVLLDPQEKPVGDCRNINQNMLKRFQKDGELAKLTVVARSQLDFQQ